MLTVNLKENIWDKATPFCVEIVRWSNPTGTMQVYYSQFSSNSQKFKISFAPPIEPGTYEVRVGFYLISELNNEYTPFYSKSFNIAFQ